MKKSKGVAIIAIILACLIGLGYYTSTIMTATSTSQKKTDNKTESEGIKLGLDLSGQSEYSHFPLGSPFQDEPTAEGIYRNTKVATELYDGQYQRRTVGSSHQTDGNRISGENSERKHIFQTQC